MISSSCELWHCVNIGAALWRHSTAQRSRLVWLRPPVTLSTTTGTVEPSITTGSSAICSSQWLWHEESGIGVNGFLLVIIVDFLSSVSLWRREKNGEVEIETQLGARTRNEGHHHHRSAHLSTTLKMSTVNHPALSLSLYCARHVTHLHDSAGIYESNVDWGEKKDYTLHCVGLGGDRNDVRV